MAEILEIESIFGAAIAIPSLIVDMGGGYGRLVAHLLVGPMSIFFYIQGSGLV